MNEEKDNWKEFVRCCEKYPSVIFIMISDFAGMFFKTSLVEKFEDNAEEIKEELMLFAYSFIRKNIYLDDDSANEIEKNYNYRYEQMTESKQTFNTKKLCSSDDIAAFCYQYCTCKLYKDWKASAGHPDEVRSMVLSIRVPEYLNQLEEEGFFLNNDFMNDYFKKFPKVLEQKSNVLKLFGVPDRGNLTRNDFLNQEISGTLWPVVERPFWYTRYINKFKNADKLILLCLTRLYKRWEKNSDMLSKIIGVELTGTTTDFTDKVDIEDWYVIINKEDFLDLLEFPKVKINLDKKIRKIMKTEKISIKEDFSDDFTMAYTYEWILGYKVELDNIVLILNPLVVSKIFNGHTNFDESKILKQVSLKKRVIYFLHESKVYKLRKLMPVITGLLLSTGFYNVLQIFFGDNLLDIFGEDLFNMITKIHSFYCPAASGFAMFLMIIIFV